MKATFRKCHHCHENYIWRERQNYCSIKCAEERGLYRRAQFGASTIEALLVLEERGEEGVLEESAFFKMFSQKIRPLTTAKMENLGHLWLPRYRLTRFGRAVLRYWRKKGLLNG